MDDVCIRGRTKEEHDQCVREVRGICWQHGLTLNCEKGALGVIEMVFIGNVIRASNLTPRKSVQSNSFQLTTTEKSYKDSWA